MEWTTVNNFVLFRNKLYQIQEHLEVAIQQTYISAEQTTFFRKQLNVITGLMLSEQ